MYFMEGAAILLGTADFTDWNFVIQGFSFIKEECIIQQPGKLLIPTLMEKLKTTHKIMTFGLEGEANDDS